MKKILSILLSQKQYLKLAILYYRLQGIKTGKQFIVYHCGNHSKVDRSLVAYGMITFFYVDDYNKIYANVKLNHDVYTSGSYTICDIKRLLKAQELLKANYTMLKPF